MLIQNKKMKQYLILILFFAVYTVNAQQNNNTLLPKSVTNPEIKTVSQLTTSINMGEDEKLKKLNVDFFKRQLLNIIQEEYCFWTDPNIKIETDNTAIEKIKSYWSAINIHPSTKEIKKFAWQERNPWSAAFISWCMQTAGIGSNFKYAPNHAQYIIWANDNRLNNNYSNPFWAYNTTDKQVAWPVPGDLLCKNRSGKQYTLNTIFATAISHCDIVLEVDKPNGIVTTIGGNVLDKVNKRWVFLNENGYIDREAKWLCFDANGIATFGEQKDFFSIIKVQ